MSRVRTAESREHRIDVGDVVLTWGDRARWKAQLREQSRGKHLEKSVGERLRVALDMVLPARDRR